jgi:hypothetical protein
MQKFILVLISLIVLVTVGSAQESSIISLANFQDGWGNTGSFWLVSYEGTEYVVLKIKSKEKTGAADIVLTRETLKQFEDELLALKAARNTLKSDGFQVISSIRSGDAVQNMVVAQINDAKFKTVQVVQEKKGEPKQDHSIALSTDSYYDLKRAIKTVRRKMKWQ